MEVLKIVELPNEGKSFTEIAKIIGCSTTRVSNIKSGYRWSSVTGIEKVDKPKRAKLTELKVLQIKQMAFEGKRLSFIGRQFGQTYQQIHQIVIGKRWGHVAPELNREVCG